MSDVDDGRKLFVGGLSWETTSEKLREYMSRFGEVIECSIKIDSNTGRSRGFGFVIFKTMDEASNVLKNCPHNLDGKIIDPKRAVANSKVYAAGGDLSNSNHQKKPTLSITKKIFIGGIKQEIQDEAIREHFQQYGNIMSCDIPIEPQTHRRRGFCFIEFEDFESAERALRNSFQKIGDLQVEVKPAFSKEYQGKIMNALLTPKLSNIPQQQSAVSVLSNMLNPATNGAPPPGIDPAAYFQTLSSMSQLYQTFIQTAISLNRSTSNNPNVSTTSNIVSETQNMSLDEQNEPISVNNDDNNNNTSNNSVI